MKKAFLIATLALFSYIAAPQLLFAAQSTQTCVPGQYCALAPIPGLTDTITASTITSSSFAVFFNNLYKYLVGLAAVLAIVVIVWSGIQIMLNQDSVSTAISSKGRIGNAIFGLILVLSPVLVFSIINPSILSLSVTMKPVTVPTYITASSTPSTTSTACMHHGQQGTLDAKGNCVIPVTTAKVVMCCQPGAAQGGQGCAPVIQECDAKGSQWKYTIDQPGSSVCGGYQRLTCYIPGVNK